MANKIKVLLDTNFLLTMVRHKIHGLEDIKQKLPCEFYTLSRVVEEMRSLAKQDKKVMNEVRLVEEIIQKNNINILQSSKDSVDSELLSLSKEYVVATNDKELRRKIRSGGGKTIYIRSLTYVDVEDLLEQ